MNDPNVTPGDPNDPQDFTLTSEPAIDETAPRSYIAAGLVASLLIVLLCVIGVAILSSGLLSPRPLPTVAPSALPRIEVVGVVAPNSPFNVRGVNFAAGERVEIYVAFVAGAAFNEYTKLADAQAQSNGIFNLAGLNMPVKTKNGQVVYLVARGMTSGFTPIEPITIGSAPVVATLAVATTPLPDSMTLTPIVMPPTIPVDEPTLPPLPTVPSETPTASATPDPNAVGVWFGRYYDNPDLSEPPVLARIDQNLNFNWRNQAPGPGMPKDGFSAAWTRNENFKTTDNYQFTLTFDNGARLFIDNTLIINEWRNAGVRSMVVNHSLTKGQHTIRVEYYHPSGNGQISLSWAVKYNGWIGRYYNTADLLGQVVLKRDDVTSGDPFLQFDWGLGAPAAEVNPNFFSVDWTRTINFPTAGVYVFSADVDDGARLYIDANSTAIFDNFNGTGSIVITGTTALTAGPHALELQFSQKTGQSHITLTWARVIIAPTATPSPTPPTPPTSTPTVSSSSTPTPSSTPTMTPVPHTPTPSRTPAPSVTVTVTSTMTPSLTITAKNTPIPP